MNKLFAIVALLFLIATFGCAYMSAFTDGGLSNHYFGAACISLVGSVIFLVIYSVRGIEEDINPPPPTKRQLKKAINEADEIFNKVINKDKS